MATPPGIGFTVARLIGELAFQVGEHIKAAVLIASLTTALLATQFLRHRNAAYRRLSKEENLDQDADGIPDVYQRSEGSSAWPSPRRTAARSPQQHLLAMAGHHRVARPPAARTP
ncbi:Na+/H+ antiporter NhaA [Streptomyces sp. NBC_00280]|uniref:Na+/H+ antiporter NhaA n=1 Tax=Streptomyces sp. NBC_00280 TaxID=2975699 RepID=UPI00352F5D5B